MMKKNNKVSLYIIPFIISFVFIVFMQSLNINNSRVNIPLKAEKESAIFFERSNGSENYISMRISRTGVFEIFMGRDTLPSFVKKVEEYTFFKKVIRLSERNAGEIAAVCSILQRYKERILLIW